MKSHAPTSAEREAFEADIAADGYLLDVLLDWDEKNERYGSSRTNPMFNGWLLARRRAAMQAAEPVRVPARSADELQHMLWSATIAGCAVTLNYIEAGQFLVLLRPAAAAPAAPTDDDTDLFYPQKAALKREDWDATTRKPKVHPVAPDVPIADIAAVLQYATSINDAVIAALGDLARIRSDHDKQFALNANIDKKIQSVEDLVKKQKDRRIAPVLVEFDSRTSAEDRRAAVRRIDARRLSEK